MFGKHTAVQNSNLKEAKKVKIPEIFYIFA